MPMMNVTQREVQIAFLVAKGMTNRQIAAKFRLSPATIKAHIHNALKRNGIGSRIELAIAVMKDEEL